MPLHQYMRSTAYSGSHTGNAISSSLESVPPPHPLTRVHTTASPAFATTPQPHTRSHTPRTRNHATAMTASPPMLLSLALAVAVGPATPAAPQPPLCGNSTLVPGRHWPGDTASIASLPGVTAAAACAENCCARPGCTHWVWTRAEPVAAGSCVVGAPCCWLKAGAADYPVLPNSNCTIGVLNISGPGHHGTVRAPAVVPYGRCWGEGTTRVTCWHRDGDVPLFIRLHASAQLSASTCLHEN